MSKTMPTVHSERVLVLMPENGEGSRLQELCSQGRLPWQRCRDMDELCRELAKGAGAAVLAEPEFEPLSLQHLVQTLQCQEAWSDFPLLLVFDHLDRSLEADLRMLDLLEPMGNVTVLTRPVSYLSLASALRSALRARRHQYRVRDLLRRRDRDIAQRDRFLNLLAHELRNPLATIRNATHILERMHHPSSPVAEQHALIDRQTSKLAMLIDEVLEVYQILAGKVRPVREQVNLVKLAGDTLRMMAADAEALGRRLAFSPQGLTLYVEGDPQRLEKAFHHLLTYALRLPGSVGPIELALTTENEAALARIRIQGSRSNGNETATSLELFLNADNGQEIPIERAWHVGLALVRSVVELHGGSISLGPAESERDTEIAVRFPLAKTGTRPAAEAPVQSTAPQARRVLVIEDDADCRKTMRLMLQLWGHQVDVAENAVQGIRKSLAERPEVVLVDIGLPDRDGYEVAREVRAGLGRDVFLVALTGFGQPHDRPRALQANFDAHLVKPVVPSVLRQLLAETTAAAVP